MAYTLEQALGIDCGVLKTLIDDYNNNLIPNALAEVNSGNLSQFDYEQKINDIQDLRTDVGILETAYVEKNCATTININPLKPEPIISVSSTLNFGNVEIGKTKSDSFTVTNSGNADLIITNFFINPSPQFTLGSGWPANVSPNNPITLKPGESTSALEVIFSPTGDTQYNTRISFFTTPINVAGNNAISISGRGVQPTDLGVDSPLGRKATGTTRIFVLRNVREVYVKSKNNPDINSPYFDSRETIGGVRLIADIWQCYTKPGQQQRTQKMVLDGVTIGRAVGSFWYEDCDQFIGGLLPAYQYYYNETDLKNYRSWKKEELASLATTGGANFFDEINQSILATPINVNESIRFKNLLDAVADEIDDGTGFWGEFNANNPDAITCGQFQKASGLYVHNVVSAKLTAKSSVKIYDGRNDQKQTRSVTTNVKIPDLLSAISGIPERTIPLAYISKVGFGRLSCLSPNTGCYVVDEKPATDPLRGGIVKRPVGEQIVKLAKNGRSAVPEQIPSDPCYRGYRTKYIRGFVHEQKWEVQLNCLGGIFNEYEWRVEDSLFEQEGQEFEVWEDVQFAGTEIGFNDVCIPDEVVKDQEPYVDASDIRGCYELHTSKIFHKYPDYSVPGMEDYIKGPQTLTTQDYSGLGPGIKLSRKVQRADCIDTPVRVFHPLIKGKDIMAARDILVTKGLFNHTQSLLSYSTSSKQSNESKKYYYDIVDETRVINGEPVTYLSVAYGNKYGSGSLYEGYEFNDSPSRAVYGQYRLLALDQSETEFKFYNSGSYGSTRKDIYAISFNRDSLTDRIDPGNFELSLSGNGGIITLIDNSSDILEDKFSNQYVYSYFDVVSGSLSEGIHPSGSGTPSTNPNFTTYGRVYPNLGFIVLDAEKLDNEILLGTDLGNNVEGDNAYKIFTAISGAASLGYPLKARSSKNKKTNHYFVRVGAATSNYTNNPTITDETLSNDNYIKNEYFKYRPTTYITTVGLYNDMNELLAVAKLSKPILKTPDKDILIKIRLNW